MAFSLFELWTGVYMGFSFLSIDQYREDDFTFSLFGISYDKEDKILGIDFLYKYFEFNFLK